MIKSILAIASIMTSSTILAEDTKTSSLKNHHKQICITYKSGSDCINKLPRQNSHKPIRKFHFNDIKKRKMENRSQTTRENLEQGHGRIYAGELNSSSRI